MDDPNDDETRADRDWNTARFEPLEDLDPSLADELTALLVDEFLSAGGLSARRREQALREVALRRGVTGAGVLILAAELPLGSGQPEYEWDGTLAEARTIARSMGEVAGRTIAAERVRGCGDTGWEPRFDGGP